MPTWDEAQAQQSAEDDWEQDAKGKPTIDSLFARFGDGLAAATVLVSVHTLALSREGYFAFTVALVLVWLAGAVVVVREHAKLIRASEAGASPEPDTAG